MHPAYDQLVVLDGHSHPGIMRVATPSYGEQWWVLARVRRPTQCVLTDAMLPRRARAWRPVAPAPNAGDRIGEFALRSRTHRSNDA